jgi:hypothetical protein
MGWLPSPARVLGCLLLGGATVFAACGGKTAGPDVDSGGTPPTPPPTTTATEAGPPEVIDAGGRICPSSCTTPHKCCNGGCGGLPVAMPNACCSCLPNEVSSLSCANNTCGG